MEFLSYEAHIDDRAETDLSAAIARELPPGFTVKVRDGLETTPDTLSLLFSGRHDGNLMLKAPMRADELATTVGPSPGWRCRPAPAIQLPPDS